MAGSGPEQSHWNLQDDYGYPDSQVILESTREHEPAQRQKNDCVGDQMSQSGMAERCCQHPPDRQPRAHRQIPGTSENNLIYELLAPGDRHQQQRQPQTTDQGDVEGTTMMINEAVGGEQQNRRGCDR